VISVFHDLLFQPAIYPLLLIAGATERVRIGPAALNPSTLHPVELAGQAAALDLASGGRTYLGLVAGAWLDLARLCSGQRSAFASTSSCWSPAGAAHQIAKRPSP